MKDGWKQSKADRWYRGPLRVYRALGGGRYEFGMLRNRVVETVSDAHYTTAQEAMAEADRWAKELARLLRKVESLS